MCAGLRDVPHPHITNGAHLRNLCSFLLAVALSEDWFKPFNLRLLKAETPVTKVRNETPD